LKSKFKDSEEKKKVIVDAADDKKANYITTLDLRGKTLIADYFVICTGTSNVHIRAIADGIMEEMEKRGVRPNALEGYSVASWVLLDYGDIVTHIMSEEHRSFYKLEGLWSSGEVETPAPEPTTIDV
jgi:ribosome-associated protein